MTPAPTVADDDVPRYRIGEVAHEAGVSPRTLRYYQELGLIAPAGASPGGSRRYSAADAARLRRILELRDVLGLDLERIKAITQAEDRLAQLRAEFTRGVSRERHRRILSEATAINREMRAQVESKLGALQEFLAELDAKAARYRQVGRDLGVDLGPEQVAPRTRGPLKAGAPGA
ncbi:MAG: MerR family transcriptional regulator [Acidimicrobiales bacterium]